MINQTIHGYTITHLLGSGGMSDVYLAENKLGKKAAIKVLKPELNAFPEVRDRFEQEARIMVGLEHRHIRQAYDLGDVDGRPAMIMEYLEGQTLKDTIANGKLNEAKARKYFEQCVEALKVTHEKGIVHRDIKPSNIFITREDDIKIMDFGIAKVRETDLGTRTHHMLGTPVYMSPEQIRSPKNVTTQSDIYSLAVTFYHALSGRAPYDSATDSDFEIQSKIVHEHLDLSHIPPSWHAFLCSMLIKDSNQRISMNNLSIEIGVGKKDDETLYDSPHIPIEIPPVVPRVVLGSELKIILDELIENMVYLPSGKFLMGCNDEILGDCFEAEKPARLMSVGGFSIARYPITQKQWKAIIGSNPSNFKRSSECPVEMVSWDDAQEFIKKLNQSTGLNFRLPFEAEWEYAARANKNYKFSGSDYAKMVAWYSFNSHNQTHPVGQKSANDFGLFDMSGNVWEWCLDEFNTYGTSPSDTIKRSNSKIFRVNRGGSWVHTSRYCRVSSRGSDLQNSRLDTIGFRLAK